MATAEFYSERFYDQQEAGSLRSARRVLREVWRIVKPVAVIDVGCGVAPWLRAAADLGARTIVGIDGEYVSRDRLLVDPSVFHPCDLENGSLATVLPQPQRFDLIMCLEVAEHLSDRRAHSFISDLCNLGDMILFSAAVPGQGGTNHINEQWPFYWNAVFQAYDFACFDILRPKLWSDPSIEWWYAQNVLLFARNGSVAFKALSESSSPTEHPLSLVHPRMHEHVLQHTSERIKELEQAIRISSSSHVEHIQRLQHTVDALQSLVTRANDELQATAQHLAMEAHERKEVEKAYAALLASTSWRVTSPLRAIKSTLMRK
jgi:SAM-dependent methyltransferase